MKAIDISVVTVVYNGCRFIEETMASVRSQIGPLVEHWVIDGGSTDGTLDIIRLHAFGLAGWLSEPDDGIADAFNKGLSRATGRYVMFLNADDALAHPSALADLLQAARAGDWPDVVYGDCDLFDPESGAFLYRAVINYDHGRFCVQFMTFRRTTPGLEVLRSWQAQCIEWCFARYEPGRFGDQKYLDNWPMTFPHAVHIVKQTEKTLAPWNASWFATCGALSPVFFHFQGMRLVRGRQVLCSTGYRIDATVRSIYYHYLAALSKVLDELEAQGLRVVHIPRPPGLRQKLRDMRDRLSGTAYWSQV